MHSAGPHPEGDRTSAATAGIPIRAMAFNIWFGGRLDGAPGGAENLDQIVEFVREIDPDVLFMVETYGSGEYLTRGLNRDRPPGRRYSGVRITREPGQRPDGDNLWLFTRFDVEHVYPIREPSEARGEGEATAVTTTARMTTARMTAAMSAEPTSFHFGGARLRLPDGGTLHAFPIWLHYLGRAFEAAGRTVAEIHAGRPRTLSDADILATDEEYRLRQARTLLDELLPGYVGDDPSPILLGGDLNTLSHLDWSAEFADAPGHAGLVLDWPVTRLFTEAGFVDTFRAAHPDAGAEPGRTWSPVKGYGPAPIRMDYILVRGEGVHVRGSFAVTERLPRHRRFAGNERYPFYSDHGAVVTDLLISSRVARSVNDGRR